LRIASGEEGSMRGGKKERRHTRAKRRAERDTSSASFADQEISIVDGKREES